MAKFNATAAANIITGIMPDNEPSPQSATSGEGFKIVGKIVEIPINRIIPNKDQPREDTSKKVQELAESIKAGKLIGHLSVFDYSGQKYMIEAGHRRYEAYKLLGRKTIPCLISPTKQNKSQLTKTALIENMQREGLNIYETSKAVSLLRKDYKTNVELCQITGYKESSISEYLNAYSLVESGEVTKDDLIKNGIKKTLASSKKKSKSSPAEVSKKTGRTKTFKVTIKKPLKLKSWEKAAKELQAQLDMVQAKIKKLKNDSTT